MTRLANLSRAIAFGRHIPVSKLLRRLQLSAMRRLRDRLPPRALSGAAPPRASVPPQPLFAPRAQLAPTRDGEGWVFRFLGRAVAMPGPRIDWRAPGPGAADQLWRMNLHYMEYLEGVDDTGFCMLVSDWLAANALPQPGTWRDSWNSYALSLRVVIWMQQLAVRDTRVSADLRERMDASLAAQMRYLARNLETDLGGNHLVKNIKALLWASVFFAGDTAARWRTTGVRLLARELARQILPDGVHDERSAAYHNQVFADLLECRHALGADPLGGRLDAALARMAQASADLTHPDGGIVLFNDAGLSMAYPPAQCATAFTQLFGALSARRAAVTYAQAGYFGVRRDDMFCIVDCGRIAPDDLPAHGHGDVLSFELSVAGERVIVDQGVFEYVAGERRQAARSARSHNTLWLEGADQADFFGAFRCGRRPNVDLRRWEPRADGFLLEGAHDGFGHLPGCPIHVRRMEIGGSDIVIVDRIEGRTERGGQIAFLLAPGVQVIEHCDALEIALGHARLHLEADVPLSVEPACWWPDMGVEHAALRVVGRFGPGARQVRTRITLL